MSAALYAIHVRGVTHPYLARLDRAFSCWTAREKGAAVQSLQELIASFASSISAVPFTRPLFGEGAVLNREAHETKIVPIEQIKEWLDACGFSGDEYDTMLKTASSKPAKQEEEEGEDPGRSVRAL